MKPAGSCQRLIDSNLPQWGPIFQYKLFDGHAFSKYMRIMTLHGRDISWYFSSGRKLCWQKKQLTAEKNPATYHGWSNTEGTYTYCYVNKWVCDKYIHYVYIYRYTCACNVYWIHIRCIRIRAQVDMSNVSTTSLTTLTALAHDLQ